MGTNKKMKGRKIKTKCIDEASNIDETKLDYTLPIFSKILSDMQAFEEISHDKPNRIKMHPKTIQKLNKEALSYFTSKVAVPATIFGMKIISEKELKENNWYIYYESEKLCDLITKGVSDALNNKMDNEIFESLRGKCPVRIYPDEYSAQEILDECPGRYTYIEEDCKNCYGTEKWYFQYEMPGKGNYGRKILKCPFCIGGKIKIRVEDLTDE